MVATSNNDSSALESSLTSPIAMFVHKNSWYFDTGAINYLCNARSAFTSYTKFTIPQAIEDIERFISCLRKSTARPNVQLTDQSIMCINLHDVYHVFSSIANFVSGSSLFERGFYFHVGNCTLHRISDDQEVAYASMIDKLFALQVAHISLITLSSRDSAFRWHWRLGHIGFDSQKGIRKTIFRP